MSIAPTAEPRNHLPTKAVQILAAYHKAVATIEATPRWANGRIIDVFTGVLKGRKASIYLRNEAGMITLTLYRSGKNLTDRFYSEKFLMASFIPVQGWEVIGTEADYRQWNRETKRALGMGK